MHRRMSTLGLLGLLAAFALPSTQAQQTDRGRAQRKRQPPLDKGPGETRTEREKRLQRECRGRPKAGACEGHAS